MTFCCLLFRNTDACDTSPVCAHLVFVLVCALQQGACPLMQEYHDKVQALELSNYSLAQHLRAATDSRPFGAGPNSDVF